MSDLDSDSIPLAATLILMREAVGGPPELLVLERASTMAFAAGALVFPGGRVDAGDLALAGTLSDGTLDERQELAQRIAAIRESIEEVGLAIAIDPFPPPTTLAMLRNGLAQGLAFGELLHKAGARLDPAALTPFARWWPPKTAARRFDTRFLLAEAPTEAVASADGTESVQTFWATANALLDDADAGHHRLIFPTWCTLKRLAQFQTIAEARADGLRYGHHRATGEIRRADDQDWLCVDEGIGYPVTRRPLRDDLRA